jgi:hypothetical protein
LTLRMLDARSQERMQERRGKPCGPQ